MYFITRTIIFAALVLLGVVSMWTTYRSLCDSILPEPLINIPIGDAVWSCSIFALALSVAIGLMLFALKLAIIDDQKRLNVLGLLGLTVVAFISISFNMDVLYRVADQHFFVRYSSNRMRSVYERYLADAQKSLLDKRNQVRRDIATQEGELQAEIKGLREAPSGYGERARKEDYRLTVLEKTASVDLEAVDEALAKVQEANTVLHASLPQSIEDVQKLQDDLRVVVKDVGAYAGVLLPDPIELESPLFAVFRNLFDLERVGMKEIFILLVAIFLDLGDIIGYCLVPDQKKHPLVKRPMLAAVPHLPGPEFVPAPFEPAGEDDHGAVVISTPKLEAANSEAEGAAFSRRRKAGGMRLLRFRRW